jgi:site-specific recombinase XerC
MKNVSELLTKDHKEVESQIIEFIIQSKEKGMKRSAISNYICPVLSFAKIMDITGNTTKINKFMPAQVKSKKTYGYTHEQIQKLLDIADERMRVVILLASGSGLRIGAIPGLAVGSLQEVKEKSISYPGRPG